MRVAVYLPLLASLMFAVGWPALAARRLPPAIGAWTLTVGSALCAAGAVWSLALLSATLLDDVLPDRYPALGVTGLNPVNDLVGLAALGLLIAGCVRLVVELRARRAIHRGLRQLCAPRESGLVVLADPVPQAFAVPGRGGHIVVSSGMLAALSVSERRVLIAHEQAHLAAGHHWHTGVVRAAAILNPLLFPLGATSRYLCERWADEIAARTVGDRRLAATSLARAALATADAPAPPAAFAYSGTGIGDRVAALQAPPARPRHAVIMALLGLVALMVLSDIHATEDFLRDMVPFLGHLP
ncbi:M56 family metallopeptidase [Rugosimonospora africana]|uniref:Peptidase M48 n=1 Tax=Rugosimonospora africana TaxID=556532 RepID=A0A8J3QTX1_9ACTN|nr:M56 family metallopeptidase [Rugosimonospora africana]GIH16469.1 peptidase M48 [Rugosimonospora africana]